MSIPIYRYRFDERACILTNLGYITISDLLPTDKLNDTKQLYPIYKLSPVIIKEAVKLDYSLFRYPLYAGYGTEILTINNQYFPIHLFQIFPFLKKPPVLKARNYSFVYDRELIAVYKITRNWRVSAKRHYEIGDTKEIPETVFTHQFCMRNSPEKFPRGLLNIPPEDIELLREIYKGKSILGLQYATDFYHNLAVLDALGIFYKMLFSEPVFCIQIGKTPFKYRGYQITVLYEPIRLIEILTPAPQLVVNHTFIRGNYVYELHQDDTIERLQVSGSSSSNVENSIASPQNGG